MKTTIPNLTYKFVFFLLLLAAVSQAQNISFGDSVFKAKLLESSPTNQIAQDNMNNNIAIDADGDGEISYNEALAVYYLDVSNPYNSPGPFITDFSMIQHFVNLRSLKCAHHQISNIDLTFLGSLWTLDCSYNDLGALDIPFA